MLPPKLKVQDFFMERLGNQPVSQVTEARAMKVGLGQLRLGIKWSNLIISEFWDSETDFIVFIACPADN